MTLRRLPWVLAIAGVLVPLVADGFTTWLVAAAWLLLLAAIRLFGRVPAAQSERIGLAAGALAVLFLLGYEGGWWLVPAVVTWLILSVAHRTAANHRPVG